MQKFIIATIGIFIFILSAVYILPDITLAEQTIEKVISLDVRDMELADVLKMIADQSGLNIVTSNNVRGKVSINLQNVGVEEVLDSILKVNNCTYLIEGNIIQVYTLSELKQKEQFSELKTHVYSLKHIKATDLKPLLDSLKSERGKVEAEPKTNRIVVNDTQERLTSIDETVKEMDKELETKVYQLSYARPSDLQKSLLTIIPEKEGEVVVDTRTNSLVVTASPLLIDKINVLVHNWDRRIPQVLIEARIIQITLEKGKFLGVDWQTQDATHHSISVGAKNLPVPTGVTYVDAFKYGVLDKDHYQFTLRALEGLSDVNLISSPRVVTLDNEEAKILIGSSEPYEVLHYDDRGYLTTKELKFIEVGIKLTVVPKIAEDGFITMRIHPEVSSPRKGTVTTDALALDTTEATTVLSVKDGNTVVLGGLIKDEEEKNIAKVPLLGDIPFLGGLFRNKYTKRTKKEIVIFITPKIVSSEQMLSPDEENRLEKSKIKLKMEEESALKDNTGDKPQ